MDRGNQVGWLHGVYVSWHVTRTILILCLSGIFARNVLVVLKLNFCVFGSFEKPFSFSLDDGFSLVVLRVDISQPGFHREAVLQK